MKIDETIIEWTSKKRRIGCVSATNWFCKRVKGFTLDRLPQFTSDGGSYSHVVASNGCIRIDLAPYTDKST